MNSTRRVSRRALTCRGETTDFTSHRPEAKEMNPKGFTYLPKGFGKNPKLRDPITDERDLYKWQRDLLLDELKRMVMIFTAKNKTDGEREIEIHWAKRVIAECEKGEA